MTIPVMKPWLGDEEAAAVVETIKYGWVAQGPRVAEFERGFAEHVMAKHGVAVSSCTAGLHLALHVLDLKPTDKVVVPSFSFIATANAVRYVGATPVFADVERATGNLSAKTIEQVLTDDVRAVILVHQGGVPADVDEVRAACASQGVVVVEDAACAAGSTYRGRPVGAGAPIAAWSFHPRKLLTTGEGGMLTVQDEELARRLRRLREHGMNVSAADRHASGLAVQEQYLETGFNYRMTDVQAALGIVQLSRLDALVQRRRELAARYRLLLADIPGLSMVEDPAYGETNYQSCWVALPDDFPVGRDELLADLAEHGIGARRGIMAAHREPAYAAHAGDDLPVTDWMTQNTLILPLFHQMTEAEQDQVIERLHAVASR
jgi:dTDP-4-amino-4,6-dideoxygalactose transaminase